jgi:hypothetical protein
MIKKTPPPQGGDGANLKGELDRNELDATLKYAVAAARRDLPEADKELSRAETMSDLAGYFEQERPGETRNKHDMERARPISEYRLVGGGRVGKCGTLNRGVR